MSEHSELEPSPPEGISLDELAQAFAQVMGTAPKLRPAAATADSAAEVQGGTVARPTTAAPAPSPPRPRRKKASRTAVP